MKSDLSESYHDELRSSRSRSPLPANHLRKRRKIIASSDCENSPDNEDPPFASSATVQEGDVAKSHNEDDQDQGRSKSKYRIHIPKNGELPTDAFFTQPPRRSSSPYRIDHFHWQKPKNQSPVPHVQSNPRLKQPSGNPQFNHPSALPSKDDTENVPPRQSDHRNQADDEFGSDESFTDMLADFPSDAFACPDVSANGQVNKPILVSSQQTSTSLPAQPSRLVAPTANLRQTTLFGTQAPEVSTQSQSARRHNWPLANREEPPTHHKLDRETLKTWVYPMNIGTIRDYQYSIVARGLYHNMLVALPTGLGKTFIAATIMLNWFRWTMDAQIVFVAPTKPLVSQQVKACFDIAGIPRSTTTVLTGSIPPGLRAEEWQTKRVFFMTPQTIINDLKTGICDPKKLVLLVVDEAHRATGGYAYVEVVKFLRRFNSSFRVLALTATPGSSVESVQEVIDGLGISRVEIRTEESLDIRQYVHPRKIDTILFENTDEMAMIMDLFSRALQPVLDKLNGMNAYWARDPMTLTPFGCNQARQRWMSSDAGSKASWGIKGMVNTIFSLLASLAHGIELLKFHGIGPFYHKVLAFRDEVYASGKKGGRYATQISESEPFQTLMSRVQLWINAPDFIGHPKLEYLQSVVMNHFLDAGEGREASDPASTKIMVFAHYRDSAEEIARVLSRNDPMVRPHVFVGQATSKGSEGMDQKKQLDIIKKFQSGIYNTLVATSIGEEGLDIGEVDLIVCYDASASPIRMLQRMGRTGRKRAGNIVVTLMKGKEENNFIKAKDNYEKMQAEIAMGTRFNFRDEESKRIVPRDIQPVVDKRIIEIPLENTQPGLPEPTKRGRAPKRPPKKFHMPDGVRTGFVKASKMDDVDDTDNSSYKRVGKSITKRPVSPARIPSLDEVLLTTAEEQTFERNYLDVQGDGPQIVEVPRNDAFPTLQRTFRPTRHIPHSQITQRFVRTLQIFHDLNKKPNVPYRNALTSRDREAGLGQAEQRAAFWRTLEHQRKARGADVFIHDSDPDHSLNFTSPGRLSTAGILSSENVEANTNEDENEMSTSTSTLSPLPNQNGRRRRPIHQNSGQDIESEDDLPDFGTLVRQDTGSKPADTPKHTDQPTSVLHRRGGRKVVQDDSDEG
ncbi:3'-5' DNA helicase [Lecanora helva]